MRLASTQIFVLSVGFGISCSANESPPTGSGTGRGGNSGASSGGIGASGGAGGVATGGSQSGGSTAASGGTRTGGTSAGGSAGTGTGGTACTNVRPTGTDWDDATCDQWATETEECASSWMIDSNYCNESCGRCSSGTGGTGGTSGTGTGGTTPVVIPDTCTEADREVCNNMTGQHCGYTFEYWKDQGGGCLTNTSDGFSVEWTNVDNLLGRKGIRPGTRNQVVTYRADYQPVGSSYLCVYGWTRSPLVEYYIVDSWGDWRPPGEQALGSITTDGGTYELYRTVRMDAPSIEGTRTFDQYWSVRTEKRTSGVISVARHFDAWEDAGLPIGSFYEVSMTVEGYRSSGTANVALLIE